MQRLLDGLIDGFRVQPQQRADTCRRRRPQMGDVVDLVFVQADAGDQIDLDFIAGGKAADQVSAGFAGMLGDGQNRRDVVAGMRVIRRQIGVVEVQFAHRHTVGIGRPFRRYGGAAVDAEDGRAGLIGMGHRLRTGRGDRAARNGRRRDGCVVDDAVDDHVGDIGVNRDGISGDLGDFPRQLVFAGQFLGRFIGADVVGLHVLIS